MYNSETEFERQLMLNYLFIALIRISRERGWRKGGILVFSWKQVGRYKEQGRINDATPFECMRSVYQGIHGWAERVARTLHTR